MYFVCIYSPICLTPLFTGHFILDNTENWMAIMTTMAIPNWKSGLHVWFARIKHDPVKGVLAGNRLHSSEQHKERCHNFIQTRNKQKWFLKD